MSNKAELGSELPELGDKKPVKKNTKSAQAKTNKKQSMPMPMKILFIGVIALVLFIVIRLVMPGDEQEVRTERVEFTSAVSEINDSIKPQVALPESSKSVVIESTGDASKALRDKVDELEVRLIAYIQASQQQIEALQTMQSTVQTGTGSSELKETLQNQIADMQSQLSLFMRESELKFVSKAAIADLENKVESVDVETKRIKQILMKENRKPLNLPFKLVSIDIWNGKAYAAVAFKGRVSLLTEEDRIMGWRLSVLSFAEQKAVFTDSKNQMVEISAH